MGQFKKTSTRTVDPHDCDTNRSRTGGSHAAVSVSKGGLANHGGAYDNESRILRWERCLMALAAVLLVIVLLLTAGVCFAVQVSKLDTIYPNVTINDVDVGGMTKTEAKRALENAGGNVTSDAAVTVRFSNDKSITVTADALGLAQGSSAEAQAQTAYSYGREGSLLSNLKAYISCRSNGVKIAWDGVDPALDEEALHELVARALEDIDIEPEEQQVEVTDTEIHLRKPAATVILDETTVCSLVREAFASRQYGTVDYTQPLAQVEESQEETDAFFQQLYRKVYTEPSDAYIDTSGSVVESRQGVSFDIAEAKTLWSQTEPGGEITIPLVLTDPAVKTEDLAIVNFQDLLAEKSTTLAGSTSSRIKNITLAAQAMNGVVINPGEEFNYNQCLGERTTAKGYESAGAFSGGQHVMSIGGGICQGSSTLYYCALMANLEITTRWCHQFLVTYLPRGLDATVSWGWPDFNFVNSRDYPIKIEAYVSDGYLTVKIWGTDVDGSYVVMTSSEWEDAAHYYAQTYRNVYDRDGNLLFSSPEAYSSYDKEGVSTSASAVVTTTSEPTPTAPPADTPAPPVPDANMPEPAPVPETSPTPGTNGENTAPEGTEPTTPPETNTAPPAPETGSESPVPEGNAEPVTPPETNNEPSLPETGEENTVLETGGELAPKTQTA